MIKRKWLVILGAVVVGALYLVFWRQAISFDDILGRAESLSDSFEQNPLQTIAIYMVVYIAATALSLPVASALSLLGGVIFGWVLGYGIVAISATIGSIAPFLLARKALRPWAERPFAKPLDRLDTGLKRSGNMYFLSARLVPFAPYYVINLVSGLTSLKLKDYALLTLIGITPGTLAITFIGNQLGGSATAESLLNPWLLLGLLVLSTLPIGLKHTVGKLQTSDTDKKR